jgi:YD repeat-containing protein
MSWLLSVLHQSGGVTIDGAGYTLGDAGNRTSKQNLMNAATDNYTYDLIYQLTQVTQGSTTESYSYDAVGNRLSSLGLSPYQYNNSNQLTSKPDASYTFDNNGNTLTKADSNGVTGYTWDYENRLTSVTLPGSGGTVTFKYDPFGRRIQKVGSAGTTIFVYDGANVVDEVNSAGAVTAQYAQGRVAHPFNRIDDVGGGWRTLSAVNKMWVPHRSRFSNGGNSGFQIQ